MKNDIEKNCIEFHYRAKELFFNLYNSFTKSIEPLNRQIDENVFQQLQGKFALQLKQQLNFIAGNILDNAKEVSNYTELNQILSHHIEEYEKEFLQKTKSL